jgi:hypothetical protein
MNLDGYTSGPLRRMADAYERMAPVFAPREYEVGHCHAEAHHCRARAAQLDGQPYDTPADPPLAPPIQSRPHPAAETTVQGSLW